MGTKPGCGRRLLVTGAFLVSVIAAACSGTSEQQAQPEAGYRLRVSRAGLEVAQLTLADLRRLESVSFVSDGKEQTGPPLVEVLASAGIADFTAVSILGKSRGRLVSRELRLRRDQVTAQVILHLNKRGDTKLATPDLPSEQWVIDVTELEVE